MTVRSWAPLIVASLLSSQALAAAKPSRPKVAVLQVEAVQGVSAGTAKVLTSIVTARAGAAGFDVVSSAEIASMLSFEKQKQLMGCTEGSCLAEIGGALGVDYLLSSQVGTIGSRFHLALSLADVRKATIVARQSQLCDASEDVLVDVAQKAVGEIFKSILAPASTTTPATAPATQVQTTGSEHPSYVPPALTTALAVGALAAAIGCGVTAQSDYNALAKKESDANYADEWRSAQQGIRQRAMAADILYGAAAVTAGISIWLWVRAATPSTPVVSMTPTAHGAAVSLTGSF